MRNHSYVIFNLHLIYLSLGNGDTFDDNIIVADINRNYDKEIYVHRMPSTKHINVEIKPHNISIELDKTDNRNSIHDIKSYFFFRHKLSICFHNFFI